MLSRGLLAHVRATARSLSPPYPICANLRAPRYRTSHLLTAGWIAGARDGSGSLQRQWGTDTVRVTLWLFQPRLPVKLTTICQRPRLVALKL